MPYNVFICSTNIGCRPSSVLSGQIYHYLQSNNHRLVQDESQADFIILNTCGFIEWYEKYSEVLIKNFTNLKRKVKLLVLGCLTEINRERISKYSDVRIIDDLNDLDEYFFTIEKLQQRHIYSNAKIFNYIQDGQKIKRNKALDFYIILVKFLNNLLVRLNLSPFPFDKIAERYTGKGRFFVKIGEGCVGNCSFCIIKKAKKSIVSRSIEDIIHDIKNHVDEQKEKYIILVADDCGSYGIDIGTNIIELLYQIGKYFPSLGIGIEYLYPKWIEKYGDKLLKVFRKVKIDNINISIQSGSQKILKHMNRNYNLEKVFRFIKIIKKISPKTMVYTHFLFGYPGETFRDFFKTVSTIPYFHYYYPFMYSRRKGTKISEIPDTVSKFKKNLENSILMGLIYAKFIRFLVGTIIKRKK